MLKRVLLGGLLCVLAAIGVGVWWVAYTQAGTARIAAFFSQRLERVGGRLEGVTGTLGGTLNIARFELTRPEVHIDGRNISGRIHLLGLLTGAITLDFFRVGSVAVETPEAPYVPPPITPLRFMPSFLRVASDDVDFRAVRYRNYNGFEISAQRLHGKVVLTSTHIDIREAILESEPFTANGDVLLGANRPLKIDAKLRGQVGTPENQPLRMDVTVSGNLDRLVMASDLEQPYPAKVSAILTRPERSWAIQGAAAAAQFQFDPWLPSPPFSVRGVQLAFSANPDGIKVNGDLGVPEFFDSDFTVAARGRYSSRVLTLDAVDLSLKGTPARLQTAGTLRFQSGPPAVEVRGAWQNLQWPLRGAAQVASATGKYQLSGPWPYDFTIEAPAVQSRLPSVSGSVHGKLDREGIVIDRYAIAALRGRAEGNGALEFGELSRWRVSAEVRDIDPGVLEKRLPGRLSFTANASGAGFTPSSDFALDVSRLRGQLRDQVLTGAGSLSHEQRNWVLDEVRATWGDARLEVDGTIGARLALRGRFAATDLSKLEPTLGGRVNIAGSMAGTWTAPRVVGTLSGTDLEYASWRAAKLSIDADIDVPGNQPSRLTVAAQRIGRGGASLDTLTLRGSGTTSSHELDIILAGRPGPRAAELRSEVHLDASFLKEIWRAQVRKSGVVGVGSRAAAITETANVVVSRDRVSFDTLCLLIVDGEVCAAGQWQSGGAWQGSATVSKFPLGAFDPEASEVRYQGFIEGRGRLSGSSTEDWQGVMSLGLVDADISYVTVDGDRETIRLGAGNATMNADAASIQLALDVQALTTTRLQANATLRRDRDVALTDLPLQGRIRAHTEDANILPLLAAEIDQAAGVIDADIAVSGTPAAPNLTGRIELAKGEIDSYRSNLTLRDLGIVASFADQGIVFQGSGRAGEGRMQTSGRFSWVEQSLRGELKLSGQNLLVADLPEYRVLTSPDLNFSISGSRVQVSGDIEIPSARVQPVDLRGAVRVSSDARFVDQKPLESSGRMNVSGDVRISLGSDVRLDVFGLQGKLQGSVSTQFNNNDIPIGRGELNVVEGRYEAYGQKLDITKGRLLFDAAVVDNPGLDIQAERTIEKIKVGMNVRGTLRSPRLNFYSEPSMSQNQIVSYLLVGQTLEEFQDRNANPSGNKGNNALAIQGGGFLASRLGKRLGLEQVDVETNSNDDTSLVLGKFLSPRLFVSYGISLTESINTLKLRYTIGDRWVLKTESGQAQSVDVEYTIER